MTTKYFNVKNGMTTGDLLVSQGNVTLGTVANLHISGGNSGYILRTDGSANLTWVDPTTTQSPAPMPLSIANGDTLTITDNYQGLYGTPITIDGTLVIDGVMVDVSGQGAAGSNSQITFNDDGDPSGNNGFTFNKTTGNMNVPGSINVGLFFKLAAYSAEELRLVTGVLGQVAALNDSNPIGLLAFWDATNNRWSYVHNNSAV